MVVRPVTVVPAAAAAAAAAALATTFTNNDRPHDDATIWLRKAVALVIALDGGACLATSLKDYLIPDTISSAKRLDVLLVKSITSSKIAHKETTTTARQGGGRQSKPKLLTFLEFQADLFHVDRKQVPHWVRLVDSKQNEALLTSVYQEAAEFVSRYDTEPTYVLLREKALYALRRNEARLERRRAKRRPDSKPEPNFVSTPWLLRQCSWELQSCLRLSGFFLPSSSLSASSTTSSTSIYTTPRDVRIVGSPEWEDVVLASFEKILVDATPSIIVIQDGRAWLLQEKDSSEKEFVARVDELLTEIVVERDGGHQVSLGLLLTRYDDLRALLGGRDMWKLYQVYSPVYFQNIQMKQAEHDFILQSKRPKTLTAMCQDDCGINSNIEATKRMKVDEVGLYSVANGKWGKAMTNLIIQAIEKMDFFPQQDDDEIMENKSTSRIAIDLTASVGGMTFAMARSRFFDKVIAVEVDAGRAQLCRENMAKHSLSDIVEVRNADSNLEIPHLPKGAAFMIDPPWGGYGYKNLSKQEGTTNKLFLGEVPLEHVFAQIDCHCSPCIVGLRLPLTFVVEALLYALKECGLSFQCFSIKKLGVQLFVVLHFPGR